MSVRWVICPVVQQGNTRWPKIGRMEDHGAAGERVMGAGTKPVGGNVVEKIGGA